MKITYLRTSMLLIEAPNGARLLTDPWFAMSMRGLPCFKAPGISLEAIPELYVILASHLHPDHFDRKAVRRLIKKFPDATVIGPRGLARACDGMGVAEAIELAEWESVSRGGFSISSVPALHTGHEINYIIESGGVRAYFGGDAKFSPHFYEVAKVFPQIDVAMLPIGGTEIVGRQVVMGPAEAADALEILKPRFVIPIHEGGTWQSVPPLSRHPGRPDDLARQINDRGLPVRQVTLALGDGECFRPSA